MRSCLKFFLRIFETCFCAGFCRFLRRIAALLCDKNGRKMPKWWHKELLKKFQTASDNFRTICQERKKRRPYFIMY